LNPDIWYVIFFLISSLSNDLSQGKYHLWVKTVKFESKLPSDRKRLRAESEKQSQTLNHHLQEVKTPCAIPYSDKSFREAAIQWLITTDQASVVQLYDLSLSDPLWPVQALDHPKFKEMIDIAARSTHGVKIPGCKATQTEIKSMFQKQLTDLKIRLNVRLFSHSSFFHIDFYHRAIQYLVEST
jgi:hypothetical protein